MPAQPRRRAGFGHFLLAEWTKIRSVRSTLWTLIAAVVVIVGFTALITWVTVANWTGPHAATRDARAIADPTSIIFGASVYLGQLAIAVLGVLVVTTEYSTGVIRASLLAVPKRYAMLAAKVVVFTVVMFILAEVIAFGSFFVGSAILHSRVSVSLSTHDVLRATFGAGLYLVAYGLFGLAIGVLVRHTAGSISLAVGVAFVLPILTGLLPDTSFYNHLNAYLPQQAGSAGLPGPASRRSAAQRLAGLRRAVHLGRRAAGGGRGPVQPARRVAPGPPATVTRGRRRARWRAR